MDKFFGHSATTHGVAVRVAVSFLPDRSRADSAHWFWSYHIRIENHSDSAVQLLTRHWVITDGRGNVHQVDGEGVVGEQPVILPGKSHDYVSGCPLTTPTGRMEGIYRMMRDDDQVITVEIPRFPLVAPAVAD
ncbi:Co2+/Mg2+ efflux protein ApaG [Blastomonas sp.]|uniref:Co2+/Mg2+ efflux protein ApaG n=1 Tax=Blastomonas sp. TaxID=1909299 RepID=UPI002625EC24|nr:Co2+/Mg2+ efflux protein ApaG [Blastomonas sp.]MDM7957071.1 Co2+/Mg2+ efflux protein ApaG [Blastomonas sp.]